MVNFAGIASDWAYAATAFSDPVEFMKEPCKYPHPSVTVELCFPKQPMDPDQLLQEKEEVRQIVWQVVSKY